MNGYAVGSQVLVRHGVSARRGTITAVAGSSLSVLYETAPRHELIDISRHLVTGVNQ